jgi:H+/gluconate symporter-like permease
MEKIIIGAVCSVGMGFAMLFLLVRFGNEAFAAALAVSFFSGLLNIHVHKALQ